MTYPSKTVILHRTLLRQIAGKDKVSHEFWSDRKRHQSAPTQLHYMSNICTSITISHPMGLVKDAATLPYKQGQSPPAQLQWIPDTHTPTNSKPFWVFRKMQPPCKRGSSPPSELHYMSDVICAHAHTHTHAHAYMLTRTHAHTHTHIRTHDSHIFTKTHTYTHIVRVCVRVWEGVLSSLSLSLSPSLFFSLSLSKTCRTAYPRRHPFAEPVTYSTYTHTQHTHTHKYTHARAHTHMHIE